jgi:hypothetical protein
MNTEFEESASERDNSGAAPLARALITNPAALVNAQNPLTEVLMFPVRPEPVNRKSLLNRIGSEHDAALSAGDAEGARLLYSQQERVRATFMGSDYWSAASDRIQLVLREVIAVLDDRTKHQPPAMPPAPQGPFDADDVREYLETVLSNGVIAGDRHVRNIASEAIGELWAQTGRTAIGNRHKRAFQNFCAGLVARVSRVAPTGPSAAAALQPGRSLSDAADDEVS